MSDDFKRLLFKSDTQHPMLKVLGKLGHLYYLEENGKPIAPRTPQEFIQAVYAFESGDRVVGFDRVGRYNVSTVFLPIDHNHSGQGEPILYETMVFDTQGNEDVESTSMGAQRCGGTRENAIAMHKRVLAWVEAGMPDDGPQS